MVEGKSDVKGGLKIRTVEFFSEERKFNLNNSGASQRYSHDIKKTKE